MTTASEPQVEFSDEMLREVRLALHLSLSETDRYLMGGHTSTPTDTDTCCNYHFARWTEIDGEQRILRARRNVIVASLRTIEARLT